LGHRVRKLIEYRLSMIEFHKQLDFINLKAIKCILWNRLGYYLNIMFLELIFFIKI